MLGVDKKMRMINFTEKVFSKINLLYKYALGILGLSTDDIILSAYPRSGSTWIRFLLCNVLSLEEWEGKKVDFEVLNSTMIELGVNNLLEDWSYQTLPRIVKTHRPFHQVFNRAAGSVGVLRDPRDIMVSYFHFLRDREDIYQGTFSDFIRDRNFGLTCWASHYASWKDHWNYIIHYEKLKNETFSVLNDLMVWLGAEVTDDTIHKVIERSSLSQVRKVDQKAKPVVNPNARFARKGERGEWVDYFNAEDLEYYSQVMNDFQIDIYRCRDEKNNE